MRLLFYICAMSLSVCLASTTTITTSPSQLPMKFNVTITTPETPSPLSPAAHKSVHVQYVVSSSADRWSIVAIEPFIQRSNRTVRQLSVHICHWPSSTYHHKTVWYDDETNCHGAPSMLIYHWSSPSPLTPFRSSDDLGFQVDKSKSIVLTVTYTQEQYVHKEQPGVVLDISKLVPRFYLGGLTVGHQQHGTRFSCRLSDTARLLYSIKPLFSQKSHGWWRVSVIRNRGFGRKLVQPVLDSTTFSNQDRTDVEILSSDIFIISGDYVLVECERDRKSICKFLILYAYKNLPQPSFANHVYSCETNDYPDLFKLLPEKNMAETTTARPITANMDSSSLFRFVFVMLVVIWISTIVGCVIMRRIRGLVNYRTTPLSTFGSQSTKPHTMRMLRADHGHHKLVAEGEQTAQLDVEHMV